MQQADTVPVPPTLNLQSDDDIDLLYDLEKAFDVKFQNDEVEKWMTIEEAFEGLKKHFKTDEQQQTVCLSARAFRKMRPILIGAGFDSKIKPSSLVNSRKLKSVRWIKKSALKEVQLELPITLGFGQCLGLLFMPVVLVVFWNPWKLLPQISFAITGLLIAIGFAVTKFCDNDFPSDIKTVGDLCEKVASKNFAKLLGEERVTTQVSLWNAFVEVIEMSTGVEKSLIVPSATFFKRN
jgi:hypothetical protein